MPQYRGELAKRPIDELVCVGRIRGAFGIRGTVRLQSFCEHPEAIADYLPLFSEDGTREFRIEIEGQTAGGLGARIDGIDTREQACALSGTKLFAERSRFPELEEDEYYAADLIGLAAFGASGKKLGTVKAVHNHGAGDILEIAGGDDAFLLAFTSEAVPKVAISESRIVVDEDAL